MFSIIRKLTFIITILILIDLLFGHFFNKYIFEKTISGSSGGSLHYLIKEKSNVENLIFGRSRAVHQINPDLLTNLKGVSYNAGVNEVGDIIYNSILLDICLNNKIKPKLIILQLDAQDFIKDVPEFSTSLQHILPFYNQSDLMKTYIEDDGILDKILCQSNLIRFNGKIINLLYNYTKKSQIKDNNGFESKNGKIDTSIKRQNTLKEPELNYKSKYFVSLKDFYNICNTNKIKLVVVFPPYYNNLAYNKELDIDFVSYLNLNYPKITIFNFSDINNFECLKNSDYWNDEIHFNRHGAVAFSNIINDSLATSHL